MSGFNRWRFFAGIIVFFAGLDVTLLLSHMSRLIGVAMLFVGGCLIASSHPHWSNRMKNKIPESLRSHFSLDNMKIYQHLLSIVLIAASFYFFIPQPLVLLLVLALIIAVWLVLKFSSYGDQLPLILVSMEFQLFVFLSTLIFLNFGTIFGYRDPPEIFPTIFLLSAWAIEMIYLHGRLTSHVKETPEISLESEEAEKEEGETVYLSERFLDLFTFHGRFKKYLPLAGIAVFVGVFAFNIYIRGYELSFGSHDGVTLLLGVVLIAYNYIPKKYSLERDFALLFLVFLFLILILPITIIHYFYGGMTEATNSPVVYHLLARPTAAFLNILGISANAAVRGEWVVIRMLVPSGGTAQNHIRAEVGIGLSCTGLYSVSIFISAFLSFIMTHFKKLDMKLLSFMGLGIFASWIANILRMTIIMVMGHLYGLQAMSWTHNNAGIFIFMVWIALFWGLMFKYFDIPLRTFGGE